MSSRAIMVTLTLSLAVVVPVRSQTDFFAELSGRDVVPPTISLAEGHFQLFGACDSIGPDSSSFTFNLWLLGVSGERNAYLAQGGVGENGPVLRELASGTVWFVTGLLSLSPAECARLMRDELYAVVTSSRYPAGEIRGQVLRPPVPVRETTWGRIKDRHRSRTAR